MKFIEIEDFPFTINNRWCGEEMVYRTVMLNADRIFWFYREKDGPTERIHILVDGRFGDDFIIRYTDRLWLALLGLNDKAEGN